MESSISKIGSGMSDVQRGLAWFITIAFVGLIFLWMLKPPTMQPESMAQLNQLVSTLQNILLLAVGFFFGSSTSKQKQDDAITAAALAPTPPIPPTAGTVTTVTTTEPASVQVDPKNAG